MNRELVYNAIVILLLGLAFSMLIVETRPLWSGERLIHEGVLIDHYELGDSHIFQFDDKTIPVDGWMWKINFPLNRTVAVYKKGNTILVKEVTKPTIT